MAILEAKGRINIVEKSVKGVTTGFSKLNKVKCEWKEMKQICCETNQLCSGNREFNIRTEKYSNI